MTYGGGTFVAMNKTLPGTYINVVSRQRATATLSDRGVVTVPIELDWGADGEIITVTASEFIKNSMSIFGYDYTHPAMFPLRELFKNATTAHVYKLNSSTSGIASCFYATARYSGYRGNDICIRIEAVDVGERYMLADETVDGALQIVEDFDVAAAGQIHIGNVTPAIKGYEPRVGEYTVYDEAITMYRVQTVMVEPNGGETLLDQQDVEYGGDLKDNDWITWNGNYDLEETAGTFLTGGVSLPVTGMAYQTYLDLIEAYNYNVMGVAVYDDTGIIPNLFAAFNRRMRDEVGQKCQLVIYGANDPDYEGVINVMTMPAEGKNEYTHIIRDENGLNWIVRDRDPASWVWWVAGAQAGCAVNKSVGSKIYDGELVLDALTKTADQEDAIRNGWFVAHRDGDKIRVLDDINSMITETAEKNSDFKLNQVIRVIDQNANDLAAMMCAKYYDKYNNNENTRRFIKADAKAILQALAAIDAIEYPAENDWTQVVTVDPVEADKQAVAITEEFRVSVAINKTYVTVIVA